jgi:hypothetical protein
MIEKYRRDKEGRLHCTDGVRLGDYVLRQERNDAEDAERTRRVLIYKKWVAEHGYIGEDFYGVIAGTAPPPPAPPSHVSPPMTGQDGLPPCYACGRRRNSPRRPAGGDDGLCYACRISQRGESGVRAEEGGGDDHRLATCA